MANKQYVAEKMAAYLRHDITLAQLIDWAEQSLMDVEFEESEMEAVRSVVSRLGVADVRAFGLTWEDCQELLNKLGYAAHVEVMVA
jgi:cobyrinic acid a,c-diamide synthase